MTRHLAIVFRRDFVFTFGGGGWGQACLRLRPLYLATAPTNSTAGHRSRMNGKPLVMTREHNIGRWKISFERGSAGHTVRVDSGQLVNHSGKMVVRERLRGSCPSGGSAPPTVTRPAAVTCPTGGLTTRTGDPYLGRTQNKLTC